jgi:hypothetical protein
VTGRLPSLTADEVAAIASTLEITDLTTGARTRWVPNAEQLAAWHFARAHRRRYFAKPRRIGISTAFDLDDALWTQACDLSGHRVRCGVVIDTDDKVAERMWQAHDFLRQIGLPHRHTDHGIYFPGESELVGLTAGGARAGASTGFQRIRYSEFSYYRDEGAMVSLAATVGLMGEETIETTVDVGATNGRQARYYWREAPGWGRLFFPFEMHLEYRADPASITDDEWEWLHSPAMGFSDRSAAAFWLVEVVRSKCAGDVVRAMHEYPQIEAHMFQAGADRVIGVTPPLAGVHRHVDVPGIFGDLWQVEVYGAVSYDDSGARTVTPWEHSGQVVVSVDTAHGVKATNSCVLAVDKRDRRILSAFWSDTIKHDDLARVAAAVQHAFAPSTAAKRDRRATLVVEVDGIGAATSTELYRLGVPHERWAQSGRGEGKTNAERCILGAKRRIEAGLPGGAPKILAEECDELHRNERGEYAGRKDTVMTYGIANVWIDEHPYEPPADPRARKGRVFFDDALREHEEETANGRPPWGT